MKAPYRISKELFTEELKLEFNNKVDADTGTIDWSQITNKPQFSDGHWRSPVATFNDLPMVGNYEADIRLVLDTSDVYTWNVDHWDLIGANDINVEWTHLQNKPLTYPPDPHTHTFENITEKPTTYPPSPHTHTESDISNLDKYTRAEIDTMISAKADVIHTHNELHTHNNKTLLDNVSSEDITNWDTVANKANTTDVNTALALKSDATHLHDGRYYTQSQVTAYLLGKSDTAHVHASATITVDGFLSAADKVKLDGVAAGATNYTHPANHLPSIITQDTSNRFVTDAEKTSWNAKSTLALGTTSVTAYRGDYGNTAYTHSQAAHAPATAQKNSDITKAEVEAKLIGDITSHTHSVYVTQDQLGQAGYGDMVKATYDTNVDGKVNAADTADAVPWTGVTGKPTTFTPATHAHDDLYFTETEVTTLLSGKSDTSHVHSAATTSVAGFLSATDKTKLDGIASGAQVNTVTSVASKTGAVTLVKADVGLGNVDNTADASKPISTATQTALDAKATSTHVHGNITNAGAIGTTANLVIQTTTSGVLTAKTAGTTAQFLRGDGAWATPPDTNTTYAEITTAEIDAGTATTLRSISGQRVKYIQDNTLRFQAGTTAPTNTKLLWIDTN